MDTRWSNEVNFKISSTCVSFLVLVEGIYRIFFAPENAHVKRHLCWGRGPHRGRRGPKKTLFFRLGGPELEEGVVVFLVLLVFFVVFSKPWCWWFDVICDTTLLHFTGKHEGSINMGAWTWSARLNRLLRAVPRLCFTSCCAAGTFASKSLVYWALGGDDSAVLGSG